MRREEPPASAKFDELLDEVTSDFERLVVLHRARLAELRAALKEERAT